MSWYQIRVGGHLDARWAAWFDGFELTQDGDGTVIQGPVVDQAALHGVIQKVRDLGLPLISVLRRPTPTDLDTTHLDTSHRRVP
jgi:hypothetical protein